MTLKLFQFIFISLACSLLVAQDNLAWVDQQIAAIQPKRSGISDIKISEIASPIKYQEFQKDDTDSNDIKSPIVHTELTEPVKPLKVAAILNNSALIDGQWLKVSDTVRGHKIKKINSDNVLLQSSNKKLKLFIKEKNDKIKIQIN